MKANDKLTSIDELMDEKFGAVGTPEREAFRNEAYSYCVGRMVYDARKRENMTQMELAKAVGTNKSYISRLENGNVDCGVSTLMRIASALGLTVQLA